MDAVRASRCGVNTVPTSITTWHLGMTHADGNSNDLNITMMTATPPFPLDMQTHADHHLDIAVTMATPPFLLPTYHSAHANSHHRSMKARTALPISA